MPVVVSGMKNPNFQMKIFSFVIVTLFLFFFLFLNLRIYPNQIIDFDDVWQNSFEENSEMDFHRILVKFDKNLQTFPFSRMFSLWKGKEERALLWNKARWI